MITFSYSYLEQKSEAVDNDKKKFESIYSIKVKAGKRRTYFVDVRQTKGNDYYLTITESTKRFDSNEYERHKIFLYKEDFNRFRDAVNDTINHIQTELMPDYDYDEFTRRNEEYERQKALEIAENEAKEASEEHKDDEAPAAEDDISW